MSNQSPAPTTAADDARYMALALSLGRRGLGNAWPNPAVGSVIVKDRVIVGRGWTQAGGRPHAEVEALKHAKKAAQGATLYCTLEPCSHTGKSPPCADAIIKAGIARVVSALEDPNPEVAGQGHERLRAKGIAVEVGLGADDARRAHAGHIMRIRHARPFVTLKLALSKDSKVGLAGRNHRRSRAGSRVPDAGAERRHSGRHRHCAVGQSAFDLPAAGHAGALAGARGARCQIAAAAFDLGCGDRSGDADLGVHVAQT